MSLPAAERRPDKWGVTTHMDPAHLHGLSELLEEALALPSEDRAAFVQRVAVDDPLRAQALTDLLDAHDAAAAWFDELSGHLSPNADLEIDAATRRLSRVGSWRIIGLLGRGGMGAVYLAERADGQFEQQAALKLARAGFDDGVAIRRFMAERQIVAGMQHPAIAQLIDGGVTDDGRPYFVMERIEGDTLIEFADRAQLTIRQRLDLFLQLGDAVQYAHHHLIVHRDIKPSNVLVTKDGRVKLLDFGIAKLFDPDSGLMHGTVTRDRVMTPAYAAPEQITGGPITTATDVYALGVVLYELLSGQRPFEQADRSERELEEDVLTQEAERPSARAGLSPRVVRQLRGDLDVICLTALRKEATRRYGSAEQMTTDVRRHLAGLPITARPDTFRYRAQKFVGRHVAGVAMTLATVLLLAGAAAALAVQSTIAERERDKAQQVASLLVDVFEVADPSEARGAQVTAREVLDRGVARVERDLSAQPEMQADMLAVLARVHRNLGLYQRATGLMTRAVSLLAALTGDASPATADAQSRLGELQYLNGAYKEAEATLRTALSAQEREHGVTSAHVATTLNHLGKVLQAEGQLDEAEEVLRRALDVSQRVHGPRHVDVADALTNLGAVMFARGRLADAEPFFRDALTVRRAVLGDDHPLVPAALSNLATLLSRKGDLEGAETSGREARALAVRIYGADHPRVATMTNNLALTLLARGDPVSAEPLLRESLAVRRRILGNRHPDTAQSLANLALVVQTLGRLQEAQPLHEEALAIRRQVFGPRHPLVAQTLNNLGFLAATDGDARLAEQSYREALAILRATLAPGHLDLAFPLVGLGRLLTDRDRAAEAEPLLVEAVAVRRQHLPPTHKDLADAERLLATSRARMASDR